MWIEEFELGVRYLHRPGSILTEADNVLFTTLTMNTCRSRNDCIAMIPRTNLNPVTRPIGARHQGGALRSQRYTGPTVVAAEH
jgi:hypothetical protein